MAYMYKQYIRVLARWPRDNFKGEERNLISFMQRELDSTFKHASTTPDPLMCERRLAALQELADNRHANDFPHTFKTGVFGLGIEQLRETNSDAFRQQVGLVEKKPSFFQSLFKKKETATA